MNTAAARALVLDDDPWAIELIRGHLAERFPALNVESRLEPDPTGEFDVFLIDNDFRGEPRAEALANQIRRRSPQALIVAFSSTLSADLLRSLINGGCNGACEKGNPAELEDLTHIIHAYLSARSDQRRETGFLGAARAIRSLLTEWNRRLEHCENTTQVQGGGR
jgi:DNA-binding NarL/FixJ family response regulator